MCLLGVWCIYGYFTLDIKSIVGKSAILCSPTDGEVATKTSSSAAQTYMRTHKLCYALLLIPATKYGLSRLAHAEGLVISKYARRTPVMQLRR